MGRRCFHLRIGTAVALTMALALTPDAAALPSDGVIDSARECWSQVPYRIKQRRIDRAHARLVATNWNTTGVDFVDVVGSGNSAGEIPEILSGW